MLNNQSLIYLGDKAEFAIFRIERAICRYHRYCLRLAACEKKL